MKRFIMGHCIWLCVMVVLVSSLASACILQITKERDVERNMQDILRAIALHTDAQPTTDYGGLAKTYMQLSFDYRVTILDVSGNVLGDSNFEPASMGNHADRPEIRQAVAAGTGSERRVSDTTGRRMLYVALRDGDLVYRIAAPLDSINATYVELIPALLVALAVALAISPALARSVAGRITRPLGQAVHSLKALDGGSYEVRLMPYEFDELQPIADTVNSLTQHISETMRELADQKQKTEYLLDNMVDGLVLVDNDMRVLQINAAAQRFLGETRGAEGKNLLLLTHQPQLIDAVGRAVENGSSTLFDLDRTPSLGMILSVRITAIQSGWLAGGKANGAVILITDVTQDRRAQQMRSEFVANASHELKTPITSIGGFAELLAAGVVTEPAQVQDYLGRICSETARMAALIDDILRLSSLESGGDAEQEREPVELRPILEEVARNLRPQLEERGVSIAVEAEDLCVFAAPQDMLTLVTNLLDNAVKYNRPEGSVTAALHGVGGSVRLTVRDTGIGIPLDQQARIFERFYRVDKGRSRKVGGTGLGLSIVKHVAAKYKGEIFLKSDENVGTSVTVTLPRCPAAGESEPR